MTDPIKLPDGRLLYAVEMRVDRWGTAWPESRVPVTADDLRAAGFCSVADVERQAAAEAESRGWRSEFCLLWPVYVAAVALEGAMLRGSTSHVPQLEFCRAVAECKRQRLAEKGSDAVDAIPTPPATTAETKTCAWFDVDPDAPGGSWHCESGKPATFINCNFTDCGSGPAAVCEDHKCRCKQPDRLVHPATPEGEGDREDPDELTIYKRGAELANAAEKRVRVLLATSERKRKAQRRQLRELQWLLETERKASAWWHDGSGDPEPATRIRRAYADTARINGRILALAELVGLKGSRDAHDGQRVVEAVRAKMAELRVLRAVGTAEAITPDRTAEMLAKVNRAHQSLLWIARGDEDRAALTGLCDTMAWLIETVAARKEGTGR